jgi:hypothetical protein
VLLLHRLPELLQQARARDAVRAGRRQKELGVQERRLPIRRFLFHCQVLAQKKCTMIWEIESKLLTMCDNGSAHSTNVFCGRTWQL